MFSESSTADTAAAVLPNQACNGKHVELYENVLQNIWNNLTPQTVYDSLFVINLSISMKELLRRGTGDP